ncbi:MAG: hypothetical protein GY780_16135 [bacterium]|nr:hypothetical protein [bacterium]
MKQVYVLCLSVLIVFITTVGYAGEIGGDDEPLKKNTSPDEILLQDGTILHGSIIESNDEFIVLETPSLGQIKIPVNNIKQISRENETQGVYSDPDQNTIMFCPTPATLPKGDLYFRDFELFLLNFGYGVTDNFDVSFGTVFPISTEATLLTVGGKFRLLDREKLPIGVAATVGFTKLSDSHFTSVGLVAGIGDARKSMNFSVNHTFKDNDTEDTIYLVGADMQTGRKTKAFFEYFSSNSLLDGEDHDLKGFINLGIRFFGQKHSFSLSGFRPVGEDTGSFLFWPMAMYSHHF